MKIGVSSWSLNKEFIKSGMDIMEFIRTAKEDFGVDGIEIVHWMVCERTDEVTESLGKAIDTFGGPDKSPIKMAKAVKNFTSAMDTLSLKKPGNLDKVKEQLAKYGVRVLNMPIDYGNISGLDEEKRRADLQVIKMWIDVAAELGSTGARVNTGHQPNGVFDLSITAASYRELAEYAETKGVALVLENHGGMSADPYNILKLFDMVDHPNFRICPDFGNFDANIRYEGLDKIFGLNNAVLVHAKTYEFDENGEHKTFNFARCIAIAKEHRYDGYYSVEFEGPGDQREGVSKTIALLKKYI